MNAYRRMLGRTVSALLLAGAFVAVSAARADAALIVYICDDAACALGGLDVTVEDNMAGDSNPLLGRISASVAGGAVIEFASSYPSAGSPATPILTLTYDLDSSGFAALSGTPYLFATQSGFTSTGLATLEADASSGSGTVNLFTGADAITPWAPPGAGPIVTCTLDCTGAGATFGTAPYYLAIQLAPTAGTGGSARGDVTVIVPDGGSTVTLLGSVLVAFGMLRRRYGK